MLHSIVNNLSYYGNLLSSFLGNGCRNVVSHVITFVFHQTQHAFNNTLSIEILNWYSARITDVLLDPERLLKDGVLLPFTISKCHLETITVVYDQEVKIIIDNINVVVNVSDFSPPCKQQNERDAEEGIIGTELPPEEDEIEKDIVKMPGTLVVNDVQDAQQVIADYIDSILQCSKLCINNVTITTISDVSLTTAQKHTMTCKIGKIHNRTLTHWKTSDVIFKIYPSVPAAVVSSFDVSFEAKDGMLIIDFSETENMRLSISGDSGFILSMFIQQLLDNQRKIEACYVEQDAPNFADVHDEQVSKLIAKNIAETMTQYIIDVPSAYTTDKSKECQLTLKGVKCRNLNFTLNMFKGNDAGVPFLRPERDADTTGHFTFKGWDGYMEYSFQQEFLYTTVGKLQTTVGYIDNPLVMKMRHAGGDFWDMNIDIPDIYIRTSQSIIDKMMVLFNFNGIWNEYDLLYNQGETIKFRNVDISDINVRFKYYNAPVDYNKALSGNWKHVVKLIPHCDLSLTVPNVLLKYQIGWEDVIDAYIKELLTSQKIRCIKKVIYATTKRKLKEVFTGKRF